jgi:hypothetical protein
MPKAIIPLFLSFVNMNFQILSVFLTFSPFDSSFGLFPAFTATIRVNGLAGRLGEFAKSI